VIVVEHQRKATKVDLNAVRLLVCAMPGRDDCLIGVAECIVDGNVQCSILHFPFYSVVGVACIVLGKFSIFHSTARSVSRV
jgi:hypothetical protein